ncbi:MAG: DUF4139 domain-containing protein [Chloroflexi bacterium]|nr:DUF4139 domain-containing protein [Chloroflexota bacterium]
MRFRILAILAALFLFGLPTVTAQESDDIAVTVYNAGTALIRDRRTLSLQQGVNTLNFRDVAATIDATSVNFRSLTDPDGAIVLEQNYIYDLVNLEALLTRYLDETVSITAADGTLFTGELLSGRHGEAILRTAEGELLVLRLYDARDIRFPALPDGLITRPTLQWLLRSASGGEHQVEITYLAGGMNWTADYNILLSADETSLDLQGWVTLDNHSGRAYDNARLKLVAGDIHRIQPEPVFAESRAVALDMMEEQAKTVEQRELFEYQLYEVARPVSIKDNETKQIEFVSGNDIAAATFYVFDASPQVTGYFSPVDYPEGFGSGPGEVLTHLEFNTGEESGLGADLPAGRIRVYQADVDGAGLLIGEDRIDHSPEGEDVTILLGKAFDLVGERRQTDFETVSRAVVRESFEIRLRNRKDGEAVEIRVPERLYRWSDWQISESSAPFEKLDSSTIEFRVTVAPGAEETLTYTVQYTFPEEED